MVTDRRVVRLADIARIVTGKTPSTRHPEYYGGDVPFVTPSDLGDKRRIDSTERYLSDSGVQSVKSARIPAGSVMVTCIASIGKIGISTQDSVTNQQINSVVVEDEKRADPLYVYYNLSIRGEELGRLASGSVQPILNKSAFGRVEITLPPISEQRIVAEFLGALDDKIELNRKMNATLDQLARTIFRSWFVDFDPVRAKAEGREPFGMDVGTAALFPDRFTDSELGPIPEGWPVRPIGKICSVTVGGDWGKDEPFDGSEPVLCLRGVDLEHLRRDGQANAPRRHVKSGSCDRRRLGSTDVLIGGSGAGPVGRPLWCSPLINSLFDVPVIYSNFCKRLRCVSPAAAVFLDRVLQEMHTSSEILEYVNGTSVPNLNANGLLESKRLVVPPERLLEKYFDLLQPTYGLLYSGESRTLAELRDTLLPELISGRIRVPEAERAVPEVV